MTDTDAIVIIPARFDSSRFPGKPLTLINGLTMIERVWRIAKSCKLANRIFIATDSDEIESHAKSFGAKVLMTSADCPTGTDRVAQAAKTIASDQSIIISLQGDAVLTPPWIIESIIQTMQQDQTVKLATPVVKLFGESLQAFLKHKEISPTSGTCAVFDKNNNALFFSKRPIPYLYDINSATASLHRHIGLYGYRHATLKQLQALPQSPLEKLEKLEQLRALENGIPIRIVCVDYQGRSHGSVDTPQDVAMIENIITKEGELVA
ncbi:MAG: 3-deoxy-manno-octulosonate cytidylyltransferase [Proteobacteria bacterium]|nr:3-deoxy-manno-octulosonate cytidylyltransferase [Pseudomonadota bacterium]